MTKIKELTSKANRNHLNKIAGHPTDIATGDMTVLKTICKQVIVNEHFRNIGKKAFEQLTEAQQEYEKVFRDSRNGWLS